MFSRKPQTILTSKKMNQNVKTNRTNGVKETELTSPANTPNDLCYISVAGVTMPLRK